MNWFDQHKFFEKSLIFVWVFFLFFCLGLLSIRSKASGIENDIYFPMEQNENGHFTEIVKTSIENYLDSENYYIFSEYWAIEGNYFVTYYVRFPKSDGMHIFGELNNNGYLFSLYRYPSNYSNVSVGYLRINMTDGSIGAYSSTFEHFYNLGSSSYYPGIFSIICI